MRAKNIMWSAVAVAAGLTVMAPSLVARQRGDDGNASASRLIDALDDCIQGRFRDITDRFGVARIVPMGPTPHRFTPENVAELSSVRALERARMEVILYVAGVRVLRPTPPMALLAGAHARAIVKGPVRMTGGVIAETAPLPSAAALWEDGRRAMRAFLTRESYDFVQPGWTFTARPVRASTAACLQCHQSDMVSPVGVSTEPPKIGDALGVVMYGVRR
jgi:hypothetical protein